MITSRSFAIGMRNVHRGIAVEFMAEIYLSKISTSLMLKCR